jgi:hypothetical protein
MNSKIGRLYIEGVRGSDPFSEYTGVVGRVYVKGNPSGTGGIDIDELDNDHIEDKHPFVKMVRDKNYDDYDTKNYEGQEWFPEQEGWTILLKEGFPWEDSHSDERFARWLPLPVQQYMDFVTQNPLFMDLWSYNDDWYKDASHLSDPGVKTLDPIYTLSENGQDVLIWLLGQFLQSMFHHPKYVTAEAMRDMISSHFYKKLRGGLPERFQSLKMGEVEKVMTYFEVFQRVFDHRLEGEMRLGYNKRDLGTPEKYLKLHGAQYGDRLDPWTQI